MGKEIRGKKRSLKKNNKRRKYREMYAWEERQGEKKVVEENDYKKKEMQGRKIRENMDINEK